MSCTEPRPPLPRDDLEHVLEEARGARFLITGGTGFFGIWMLESFAYINDALGLGMSSVVVTRNPEAFALKAPHLAGRRDLSFLKGDIRSFQYPEGHFSYVIHAATEASANRYGESPREIYDSIVSGTSHVLEFAAKARSRKFLFTSSGAVYGKQPPGVTHIPETYPGSPDPMLPTSSYGLGKLAAEHLCMLEGRARGFEVKIARCFAFVGPHLPLDADFAVGNFIRDAKSGGPIQILGDGSSLRSYLYAADLAVWLWTLLFEGRPFRPYNVGSSQVVSIYDTAALVAREIGGSSAPEVLRQMCPGHVPSVYIPSVERARNELGLNPVVGLSEAVRKTVVYLNKNDKR